MPYNELPVERLYYIAPIGNVAKILRYGIYSYNGSRWLRPESFALESVQDRRDHVKVVGSHSIHDFANLYFNPRNATMYRLMEEGLVGSLVVFGVSKKVAEDRSRVWFSNMNAACEDAVIEHNIYYTRNYPWDVIMGESWYDKDPVIRKWKKAVMCAEVLVRDRVHSNFLERIYAPNRDIVSCLEGMGVQIPIELDAHMFFSHTWVGNISDFL